MELGISSYTYTWAIGVTGYAVTNHLTGLDLLEKAASLGVGKRGIPARFYLPMKCIGLADGCLIEGRLHLTYLPRALRLSTNHVDFHYGSRSGALPARSLGLH